MWLLRDGGVHWSDNGGKKFHASHDVHTLSTVVMGGVAIEGRGPALSLNTGESDGFYSMDGGENWDKQDYGGGDNDCSYSDPLRPYSMLIFTPRWTVDRRTDRPATESQTVTVYDALPVQLPDARSGGQTIPGPPTIAGSSCWNASSRAGLHGFKPIVLNMPGDDILASGDYIFIRFNADGDRVLLRTRKIRDIDSPRAWATDATSASERATLLPQGPVLPDQLINVAQASAGHTNIKLYVGGNKELWTWTEGQVDWERLVPSGWRLERHVRVLADLTNSGRSDIVGFGEDGVWTALSNGDGTFQEPKFVLAAFGYTGGGWRVEKHPRFLADLRAEGRGEGKECRSRWAPNH